MGGIESMIDDRDGQRVYYDINALSNFVADAPTRHRLRPARTPRRLPGTTNRRRRETLTHLSSLCATDTGSPFSAVGCATSPTRAWPPLGITSAASPVRSEQIGYDLTLVAELNLNDIKGTDAPALDAWSTAAALAAVTDAPRTHGRRPPDIPFPRPPRQASREHRPHLRHARPPLAQPSFPPGGLTRRASTASTSSSTRTATHAPPNGSMSSTACGNRTASATRATSTAWRTPSSSPNPSPSPRPTLYAGRRERNREKPHRRLLRRLRHARRPARAHPRKNRRHAFQRRERTRPAAHAIRHRRLQHRARH